MRGKVVPYSAEGGKLGITPAYAGKSWMRKFQCHFRRDHPRVCGEKCGTQARAEGPPGSPPRMRGKVTETAVKAPACRITPAYAGKRGPLHQSRLHTRDHPRVCGEKLLGVCRNRCRVGSPPRMRGKVLANAFDIASPRITPAYAGKSIPCRFPEDGGRDHPRVCGEKKVPNPFNFGVLGSPPRMRGKVGCADTVHTRNGITPAYAGKRHWKRKSKKTTKDHPRVCGEKTVPTW